MRLVLDASVCLKWFLFNDEQDVDLALELHRRVREGEADLIAPAVWRSEIAAVVARKQPDVAADMTADLHHIEAMIDDSQASMLRAVSIAIQLKHHFFDTIYHAIAIEHRITLITADEHYYRKARALGSIALLGNWHWPARGVAEGRTEYVPTPAKTKRVRQNKRR